MKIVKSAVAGTMESSDVYVRIEPSIGVAITIESVVFQQFGDDILTSVKEVLQENNVTDANVFIKDRGAIDCTIKARIETAILRAQEVI